MVRINIPDEHLVPKIHTQINTSENKRAKSTASAPWDTLVQSDGGGGQPRWQPHTELRVIATVITSSEL